MATLSDTGKPLTPFGMPSSWIPPATDTGKPFQPFNMPPAWIPPAPTPPAATPPKIPAPVTPPWKPEPERSLAYLRNPASSSTEGGQNIWDPISGRWTQISANPTPWDPNQLSKGVIIGSADPNSANYITPERAAAMGLIREGMNYVWNPTSAELTQMADYWNSPEGKAALAKYSQPGGGNASVLAAMGNPSGAPAAGYNMYNPNTGESSPYAGAYPGQNAGGGTQGAQGAKGDGHKVTVTLPDGSKVTGPAGSKVVQDALAAANGGGTGSSDFNYPMNPLGDAANQPNIQSQNALLTMMQQDPYLSGILQPYLNQAYSSIGQSGMPNSSYTDRMLAETIAPLYMANQQNVLGGYGNLTNQLAQLAATAQEPYQTALNYILSF